MQLLVSPTAAKGLADMPRREAEALMEKLRQFAAAPFDPHPWARPLSAPNGALRIRQGDRRAICRIDRAAQTVVVDAIAYRREVYR